MHGIWRIVLAPVVTEIITQQGYDFQIFDREHGPFDFQQVELHTQIGQRAGCAALARVTGLNRVEVQRCLDAGVEGIVFPQITDLADVQEAVRMVAYPPKGVRGFNPFTRGGGYGAGPILEGTPLCIPIIETLAALDDLEAILDLEEIKFVYLGAYDLSVQLGVPGKMDDPALLRVLEKACRAVARQKKAAGMMVNSAAQVELFTGWGVQVLVHSVDTNIIRLAFAAHRALGA